MMIKIRCKINNRIYQLQVDPSWRLLDILRNELGLTGTKEGCGIGECGACTVIMNKKAVCSCLVLGSQLDGAEIETVENLAKNRKLSLIQRSFLEKGAVQCGFCTPGMLMSTKALLDRNPQPSEAEIKEALSGNLCRCTGYVQILEAVKDAIKKINS